MKKSVKYLLLGAAALALATACFFGVRAAAKSLSAPKSGVSGDSSTLAAYSQFDIFASVPCMSGKSLRYENAVDDGADTYGVNVYGTTEEDYRAYLKILEENGFTKYADNGEHGLGGYVYKTYFQKDSLRLSVTYFTRLARTMISASEKGAWSEHLLYSEDYLAGNKPDAKTTLYLPELYTTGASFFFQLKNGHFIINDGGTENELPYLLDDLEKLTPEGEKPVIEAWFMSHPHIDHMGVFKAFLENKEQMDRVYVENVYYNCVSAEAEAYYDGEKLSNYVRGLPPMLKRTDGTAPVLYEIVLGDRYYFNDITVEAMFTSEAMPYVEWTGENATSTWLMYYVEGQTILFPADGTFSAQQFIMRAYGSDYLDLDVYFPSHHGYDVFDQFTDYLKRVDTVLYPNYHKLLGGDTGYGTHTVQLLHLNEVAQESYTYGEGTVVMQFPYTVGSATTLPMREWSYNVAKPPR
ncbi:MAG: MBL fold metallo-hydrolase [Oscillospiraceae bacterium]|nr:MBL fold metallo-hydrolase [Oscillospiraceae bacterium]